MSRRENLTFESSKTFDILAVKKHLTSEPGRRYQQVLAHSLFELSESRVARHKSGGGGITVNTFLLNIRSF